MDGILEWITTAIMSPWFKVFTFTMSFISLIISIWVFRRTMKVLSAQRANILSSQLQHVNQQWQELFKLIFKDDMAQALATQLLGFYSLEETRTIYFYFMFLNPIYFEYQAYRLGIMDEKKFKLDLLYIARNFKGDRNELIKSMRLGEYPGDFIKICQKYFTEHAL